MAKQIGWHFVLIIILNNVVNGGVFREIIVPLQANFEI